MTHSSLENVIEKDQFAQLVGIKIVQVKDGSAVAELTVGEQHLNGLGMVHGGVIFTLADMAFAAAANSHGVDAVAINLTVSFINAAKAGKLKAEASEVSLSSRLGTYQIRVLDDSGEIIASLQGTAYRKKLKEAT